MIITLSLHLNCKAVSNGGYRTIQSLNCYDNLENLRQNLMMEQFLETVPIDMRVWLVDQKPKKIDDMARLSDQYVALRKPVDPVIPKSLSSHNDSVLSRCPNLLIQQLLVLSTRVITGNRQILSSVDSRLL